ncbi:acetylornithine deacetylase [Paracoccus aestuarii]|uniref:Acetylornithine deacetylase n=1 Tax=Paracoccus aestuarii TaxID=453842 RepID=A0A418ZZ69_9RHOB|nr:acetylornithine deacetylase [Paracoccus aestuarii]RJL05871.1 acetylornithine deacetylase [Paracoccus aestuarii]WCQ98587.1 acetylornithine deacetylase [Paracoccus aestuarii]
MTAEILKILERLIAFPTISRQSNLALLDYVEGLLRPVGVRLTRYPDQSGTCANLWASTGPAIAGGVVLSGHSDVVPTEGQQWTTDPFTLHERDGLLYGRGAADMKGFLAVAIHAMLRAAERPLKRPLHLAISYDEEIGCVGVRSMLEARRAHPERPALCLIGEPTGMRIASGHKGKRALTASCHGQEAHSALAPTALNALHLGAAFIGRMQARQDALRAEGARDPAYDIPYSTIHVGTMHGGTALNIVPKRCDMELELRNVAADDPDAILQAIRMDAEAVAAPHRKLFPEVWIEVQEVTGYPGLDTPDTSPATAFLQKLLGQDEPPIKVAFGTEAGLFAQAFNAPTLVCGPGHMAQGHRPDEFVAQEQLVRCQDLLALITGTLEQDADLWREHNYP